MSNDITTPLRTAGSVVLDASGNGTVYLLPDNAWQTWDIARIAVRTNQAMTATPFPLAEVFIGVAPVPSASLGATYSGQNDQYDPAGGPIHIGAADALTIVWTGGIPGTIATVTVTGTKTLRRG